MTWRQVKELVTPLRSDAGNENVGSAVAVQVYVVRRVDGLWQVRLRRQVISRHRSELQAFRAAEVLARADLVVE